MLLDLGIDDEAVLTDADRPSTVKERYIGRAQHRHPQQMIRVDYEDREPLGDADRARADARSIGQQMRDADIVLISDYDKGVCTPALLAAVDRGGTALRRARRWPTRFAAAIIASITAAPPSRPTASKRAWPPAASCNDTAEALDSGRAAARAARPGSGHRHARQGRHGPGPPRRPARRSSRRGRGRSTTSPAPATW